MFATTLRSVGTGLALTVGLNAFLAQTAKGNSRDPAVLLTGAMLLGLVSAIASALPAWHASKLAPMTATAQRLRDARAYTLIGVKWAVLRQHGNPVHESAVWRNLSQCFRRPEIKAEP